MLFNDGTLQDGFPGMFTSEYFCNIREFNETSSPCRIIPLVSEKFLAHNGLLYSCEFDFVDSSQLTLVMYHPGWPSKHRVTLPISATVSQSYSHNSDKYLLLGSNDDEDMRLLLIPLRGYDDRRPAEIKTIPLTWAQARAELNRLWEEEYGNGDYELPEGFGFDSDSDYGI